MCCVIPEMNHRQLYARIENVLLAASLLVALPGASRWAELRNYFEGDWASYYLAALRLAQGDFAIYREWPGGHVPAELIDPVSAYLYPPFFAVLIMPFTAFGFRTTQLLWFGANVAMTVAAVWLTLAALRVRPSRREWLGLALAICLFPPLFRAIRLGQVVFLLLFLSALAFWASVRNKSAWSGTSIAIASLVKLYPALLLAALLLRRQWRAALAGVLAACALTLITIGLVGWDIHRSFVVDLLPRFGAIPTDASVQSLPSFLRRLGLEGTPLSVLSLALAIGLTSATFWRIRSQPDWSVVFGLVTVLMLVLPTLSWDFNYVLLILPLVALYFGRWPDSAPETRSVVLAVYILIVLERYWLLYPPWWPLYSFSIYGALGLWLWLMWRPGKEGQYQDGEPGRASLSLGRGRADVSRDA